MGYFAGDNPTESTVDRLDYGSDTTDAVTKVHWILLELIWQELVINLMDILLVVMVLIIQKFKDRLYNDTATAVQKGTIE